MEQSKFYQIKNVTEHEYNLVGCDGSVITRPIRDIDKLASAFSINDAKDGDVLCYKGEISLYKHDIKDWSETSFGGFVYYCCYDGKRFITNSFYSLTEQDKIDIHPATKEQRDTLMKAMADAGYTFDFEKKELKKIENEPENFKQQLASEMADLIIDYVKQKPADIKQNLSNSKKVEKNDTLLDLLHKMPSYITVDGIDYHFVLKKTIAYETYYEGVKEGCEKTIFWTGGDPVDILTEMLEKLKEKGLLE